MYVDYDLNASDTSYYDYDELSDYFSDDSQAFHHDQLQDISNTETPEPIPPPSIPDPSIAISNSIDQSRQLIQSKLNIDPSSLRHRNVPGIVILPLKDFNLIRKDARHGRTFKHILVIPSGENFTVIHQDFAQAISALQ